MVVCFALLLGRSNNPVSVIRKTEFNNLTHWNTIVKILT